VIPYGRQLIGQDDVEAVNAVLRGDWLTTGPAIPKFEKAFAEFTGAAHAVAVNSGTAALHAMVAAIGIGPGDEVIVPALTFVATANVVVYQGGTPVFADVDPRTGLIDPASVAKLIGPRTKAIFAVDYAGQPADYAALRQLFDGPILADGCHATGGRRDGVPVGRLADLTAFSFHPVKHLTTGEGGIAATMNGEWDAIMRSFRNHGIGTDWRQREERKTHAYDMDRLGYNYRLTDLAAALGESQLKKIDGWLARRRALAGHYDQAFANLDTARPLMTEAAVDHAYHLYVLDLQTSRLTISRDQFFDLARVAGLGVNVHYRPVHLHSFYRNTFGTAEGLCPAAEALSDRILTIPLHHGLSDEDQATVISILHDLLKRHRA